MARWCVQRPKKIVFNFQQNFNLTLLFEEFQKTLSEKMLVFKKILRNVGLIIDDLKFKGVILNSDLKIQ